MKGEGGSLKGFGGWISVLCARLEAIISETLENSLNVCTTINTMLIALTKSLSLLEVKCGSVESFGSKKAPNVVLWLISDIARLP